MSKIVINDIEMSKELDTKAMSEVSGGKDVKKRLSTAFSVGWAIGSWLDKKFSLSDRIAGTGKHWR